MVEISADRAYWLLGYYQNRALRLQFVGQIGGEQASCDAVVTSVNRDLQLMTIKLFEEGAGEWYEIPVPLRLATFQLEMLGERNFREWAGRNWHSSLLIRFPDTTSLYLAERFDGKPSH